jgi:ferredoxin--NADP+ reductase
MSTMAPQELTSEMFNATLIYRRDLYDELSIVHVKPDWGLVPEFTAGQFCMLGLPKDPPNKVLPERLARNPRTRLIRRAYSIASSPKIREYLELYVVLVEGGKLTTKLWTIGEGDRLFLDERITGEFTLDPVEEGKDLVMCSTGTGIAPFLSMLKTYRGTGRWRHYVIIHGVRLERDLGYREELEAIAKEDEDVVYIPMCTREPTNGHWQGLRGRVQVALEPSTFRELTGFDLSPETCHMFLCGNPDMIKQVAPMMEGRGFKTHTRKEPGNLHFERYW